MKPAFQRTTQAQQAVQTALQCSTTPLSLQEIFAHIRKSLPGTAFSTIYRILKRLEEHGDVTRVSWRERGSRYEWANHPHHHHVVCESCGCIEDIDDSTLAYNNTVVEQKTGFQITHHSIELSGVCAPCQKELA